MTNTLSETARSLSKAQRRDLIRYHSYTRTVSDALFRRGLVEDSGRGVYQWSLTPLGEQVRTHILTEEQQP